MAGNATSTRSIPAITPRSVAVDAFLIAVCIPLTVLRPADDRNAIETSGVGWLTVATIALSTALILARRRWPISTLAVATVALPVLAAIEPYPTGLIPAIIFLAYNVAVRTDRRMSIYAGIATLASLLGTVTIIDPEGVVGPEVLAAVAWPALAVAAGDITRDRRLAIEAAEERARRAEATREEEARRRVAEERLRIARELHDVVAHRMAVVNVQAGVAAHLLRSRPDDAEQSLAVVRSSTQAALSELSEILNVLRTGDEAAGPDPTTEPAPTMLDIAPLVHSFADAGLAVEWETGGAARPLGSTTQLAVYRVVQEALTNAHKHGDGTARLTITYADDGVDVDVRNRFGATGSTSPSGFGLIGMRERVAAAGGRVDAGPAGNGTFMVSAHFPSARTVTA